MVPFKELRKGNIVLYEYNFHIVDILLANTLVHYWHNGGEGFYTDYDLIRPVYLTPEILEKCGFISVTHQSLGPDELIYSLDISHKIKGNNKNELYAIYDPENKFCIVRYMVNANWASNNIVELHKLQNIYFYLTGEELNVHLQD